MRKFLVLLMVIAMVSTMAIGCTPEPEAVDPGDTVVEYKDTLTIATYKDPATLDPMESNKIDIIIVGHQIFNNLVDEASDGSGVVSPELATSWEYLDDTTLRFHLRDDVKFHDGSDFTAEDVLFSFTRAKANPISASTFKMFDMENSVAVDPYTVDLKFVGPFAPVFNTLSGGRAGIVPKATVEAMGDAEFARAPVGSGPYVFEEWITGAEIKLTRNDNYWGDVAKTKNLSYKVITEPSSRVIALETGEVDIAVEIAGTDAKRVEEIEGYHAVVGQSNRYTLLTFSMSDDTLANKDLRYALSYAIDREALNMAVYGDTAKVATGYMPSNVAHYKDMGPMPYDVAMAKDYMAKAGLSDGVTLDLLNDGTAEFSKVVEVIQNMWAEIGVTTNIVTNPNSRSYITEGNHVQAATRSGNANEISNIWIIYDSTFGDRLQANNDWLDAKLQEGMTILDFDARSAFYAEIADWLYEERYSVPLSYTATVYGVSDKIEGFVYHPSYILDFALISVQK